MLLWVACMSLGFSGLYYSQWRTGSSRVLLARCLWAQNNKTLGLFSVAEIGFCALRLLCSKARTLSLCIFPSLSPPSCSCPFQPISTWFSSSPPSPLWAFSYLGHVAGQSEDPCPDVVSQCMSDRVALLLADFLSVHSLTFALRFIECDIIGSSAPLTCWLKSLSPQNIPLDLQGWHQNRPIIQQQNWCLRPDGDVSVSLHSFLWSSLYPPDKSRLSHFEPFH